MKIWKLEALFFKKLVWIRKSDIKLSGELLFLCLAPVFLFLIQVLVTS